MTDGRFADPTLSGEAYGAALRETSLCLQLPGVSAECYRLYESLEAGCVPVLVDELHPLSAVQHRGLLGGAAAPFLHARRADQLAAPLRRLAADPAALLALRAEVAAWWRGRKGAFRDVARRAVWGG